MKDPCELFPPADICPDHPDALLEWDGFCLVCPPCVLANFPTQQERNMSRVPIVQTVNGKRIEIGSVEVREDGTVDATLDVDEIRLEDVPGLREALRPDFAHYSIAIKDNQPFDINAPEFQPLPQRIPGQFSALFQKPQDKEI